MTYYHEGNGMDDTTSARWITASLARLDKTCTDPPWNDATPEDERTGTMGTYTAELHGAAISDYAPIELHCLHVGDDHLHYATQPASQGRQIAAFQVERTDNGEGQHWYATGGVSYWDSVAAAAEAISDRHRGVTRICYDDGVRRYLGSERLEDAQS